MKKYLLVSLLLLGLLPCFSNAGELKLTYSNNFSIYVPTAGNWFIEKTYSPTIGMQDNAVSSMPSCGFKNMTIDGITPANLSLYTYYYTNNGGLNYISCNMSSFTNGGNFDCKPSSNVNNKGIAYCVLRFNRSGVSSISLSGDIYLSGTNIDTTSCPSCPDCPTCEVCEEQYTILECQTEYNLIPIESVDSNYCSNNNLCPSCPVCEEFSGTTSNVYINDILHLGSPIIRMNIPQEIDWDYAYTNSGYTMNIDVVGYNQDTDYIDSLIEVSNYKPDNEDFTKVFGLFKEYSGLLISLLFVILVFYFVKKLF